jgi:uracil-DNA glycosylase
MITSDRCALCPGVNTCIEPSGPADADVIFIGEAPGREEQKKGVPFVGKTGEEVNSHYLPLSGLRRSAVCFTNAIRCLPTGPGGKLHADRSKDRALLQSCTERFLYPHLDRSQPRVLVPMGAFACQAVDPTLNLELQHGLPLQSRWGLTYPMYHPALGIHEPKRMLQLRNDWIRLKSVLRGTFTRVVDPYPEPDYAEVTDVDEIDALDPEQPMGCDTEFHRKRGPYCLTYSTAPGTGRLIRAERRDLLAAFQRQLDRWRASIAFHNWLADAPVTEALGLRFPRRRLVDTMVGVYHLGNLPQGLKAIAYREMGMVMQDFDDLVTPYSTDRCLTYLLRAAAVDWPKPEEQLIRDDAMQWTIYKPQSMHTKLKRFMTDYIKSNGTLSVFERWDNWDEEQPMIEAQCGEWPGLDISHAPFEEVLPYACRDADACLRLLSLIRHMRQRVRKAPQQEWTEGWSTNHDQRRVS